MFAEYAAIVLTLLLLEAVLSFDNAAILAAMIRKLPEEQRRKALLYGLVGAYALRFLAILGAVVLLENPWLQVVGGGYLLFLFLKHFYMIARHREEHGHKSMGGGWLAAMGVPMFWATIIQIELVDLAFAVDQVVAAVAFVGDIPRPDSVILIVIASFVGILFLRLAAVYMARVMDWLPLLEHMAYIAVGFVGLKLVAEYFHLWHFSTSGSIGFTLTVFLFPVLVKLIFKYPASSHMHMDLVEEGLVDPGDDEPHEL